MPLFNLTTLNYILVGNGHRIPILGYGQSSLPNLTSLVLHDVLFAPQIIKNLLMQIYLR